ncbi:MAG: Transglutaminase-like superfamily protein, partial [Bacilli bacterium]|nr:Transglutaminase-like superfamily protein [Bacilli bacterium]
ANKWSYRPQDTMTRQEMAALLDLAMKAVPGSLAAVVTTPSATFLNENGNVVEFPQLLPWQAELKGHLENQETNFQITLDNPDEFKQIDGFVKGMFALEDYLHYVYNGMEYSYDGISKATFKVHFLETKEQSSYVTTHAKEIDASLIKQGMNDFEKEKAIHDYIISHVAYDQTLSDHTAYGALTKGTTVCQGYSLLAYRMLQEAGLPNKIAEGVAGGELHTWNVVQLNGSWYNLDTTWDDPVPDVKDRIEYTYFNLTDAQLRHDHSWTLQYPSAVTNFVQTLTLGMQKGGAEAITDQMLMNTTGLLIESSDFTADTTALASTILDRELSKGSTQIRFRFLSRIGSAAAVLKSALTNNMMQKYNINNGVTYSNQPDTRSVGYTVVDLKVK